MEGDSRGVRNTEENPLALQFHAYACVHMQAHTHMNMHMHAHTEKTEPNSVILW